MKKPRIHLICTAHLDPVWQWRWEEGCAEALATFQNAVEMVHLHKDLVFNHNEAILYSWVERYDPSLFAEIQKLVERGRWSISGGWYLQPDANLPGLESSIRQILWGRRYFHEKFGAYPRVAYNFDAFGHHGGLPQILRLLGYEMYIHMRPQAHELTLPSDLYRWCGVDGSQILCYRISVGLYHTERNNIEKRLSEGKELALASGRDVPIFWGLGDHGGGATREDLEKINAFIGNEKEIHIKHSTPEELYHALRKTASKTPFVEGDLQRTFTGCYTSLSRIKRRAQQSLAQIVQAEALCAAAWWCKNEPYPWENIQEAWRDHLFNDFHDILPGTCIEPAERDALDLYGRAAESIRRARLHAALAFNRGSSSHVPIPVTVLNANPVCTKVPVEVEFMADYRPFWEGAKEMRLFTLEGKKVLFQEEKAEALLPFNDWRRKVCFMADLPGLGAAHYQLQAFERRGEYTARPPALDCDLDSSTGLVTQIRTKAGMACLAGPLFQPLLVVDKGDSWGTGCSSYREVKGPFKAKKASVRVIQQGPVRTITESVHTLNTSRIVVHVITYAKWPIIEVRFRVQWNEIQKRLKLAVPTRLGSNSVRCEIPGGSILRPQDGQEHVHGRWMMIEGNIEGKRIALGIVNSGQHGIDALGGEIRLSALRSAAYCHEKGLSLAGREHKYMDQGLHEFTLLVAAGNPSSLVKKLTSLADWLSAPPLAYAHLPLGRTIKAIKKRRLSYSSPAKSPVLSLSPSNIRMTAFKPSIDGKALVVRFHESVGRACRARIILGEKERKEKDGPFNHRRKVTLLFKPFEIKTLRFNRNGSWKEVDGVTENKIFNASQVVQGTCLKRV